MDITLGLDIGTHQTKIALSYTPNNESIYEFVEFETVASGKTYLLPSIVQINSDNTLSYGHCDRTKAKRIEKIKPKRVPYPPKPKPLAIIPLQQIPYPVAPAKYKNVKISKHMSAKELSPQYQKWQLECKRIDQRNHDNRVEFEESLRRRESDLLAWKKNCQELDESFNEQMELYNSPNVQYHSYRYFKLACFSDQETEPSSQRYTPERLMVWYMTYVLLYVKDYVKTRFNEVFEESVSVQMGVPSGYDNEKSKGIEFKAKQLLLSARELMSNFNSLENFLTADVDSLERLTSLEEDKEQLDTKAFMYGFIIIPEAYAGLQSLSATSRLKTGVMHLLVDIGGGTTDVGFFTVRKNKKPNVHIVDSFHMGLNFIFEEYLHDHPGLSLQEVQKDFQCNPMKYATYTQIYKSELKTQLSRMVSLIVYEFLKRHDRHHVSKNNLYDAMMSHPIVFCGGGSTYEDMRIGNQYFSDIYMINKDILNIPNLVNKNIDDSIFTILATSYGLSIPLEDQIEMIDLSDLFEIFCQNIQEEKSTSRRLDYGLQDHN